MHGQRTETRIGFSDYTKAHAAKLAFDLAPLKSVRVGTFWAHFGVI